MTFLLLQDAQKRGNFEASISSSSPAVASRCIRAKNWYRRRSQPKYYRSKSLAGFVRDDAIQSYTDRRWCRVG